MNNYSQTFNNSIYLVFVSMLACWIKLMLIFQDASLSTKFYYNLQNKLIYIQFCFIMKIFHWNYQLQSTCKHQILLICSIHLQVGFFTSLFTVNQTLSLQMYSNPNSRKMHWFLPPQTGTYIHKFARMEFLCPHSRVRQATRAAISLWH